MLTSRPTPQVVFAPGKSPFRVKGAIYLGARTFYAERLGAAAEAFEREISPELRAFWRQRFAPDEFYDVLPIVDLGTVASRLARSSYANFVRDNARFVAERDLSGVSRLILKVMSPESAMMRLPAAMRSYFEFGDASAEKVGPREFRARMTRVPERLAPWLTSCVAGFVPVGLAAAGARDIVVVPARVSPTAVLQGVPIVTIALDVRWS